MNINPCARTVAKPVFFDKEDANLLVHTTKKFKTHLQPALEGFIKGPGDSFSSHR